MEGRGNGGEGRGREGKGGEGGGGSDINVILLQLLGERRGRREGREDRKGRGKKGEEKGEGREVILILFVCAGQLFVQQMHCVPLW